jgi:hypothetical protein
MASSSRSSFSERFFALCCSSWPRRGFEAPGAGVLSPSMSCLYCAEAVSASLPLVAMNTHLREEGEQDDVIATCHFFELCGPP